MPATPTFDFKLAGDFIEYERHYATPSLLELSRQTKASPTTLRRLMAGDESIKPATLRAVERTLNLPDRTIDLIRAQDVTGLAQAGLADRPLRWLTERMQTGTTEGRNSHTA